MSGAESTRFTVPFAWRPAGWVTALAVYAAATLILGAPILFRLGSNIIGASVNDNAWFAWLLWEFRQELAAGHDPGHTHLIFALLPSVQIFGDSLFNELLGAVLGPIFGILPTYNMLVLLSFVLSGFTMYLLVAEFTSSRLAALLAGFLYDFSTFHFAHGQQHLGLMTMEWLPFCAWRLWLFYRQPDVRNALLAGLGAALVTWSDIYYLPYFLLPFLLVGFGAVLLRDRSWLRSPGHFRLSLLAAVTAGVVTFPAIADYLHVDPDVQIASTTSAQSGLEVLSADLLAFVLPYWRNPLAGPAITGIYQHMQGAYLTEALFLGYPVLLLAALAVVCRRRSVTLFWLCLAALSLLLALGPRLFVGGYGLVPLPFYRLVYGWGQLASFRSPSRLGVTLLLALCVLAGIGADWLFAWLRSGHRERLVVPAVGALLALGLATQPVDSFLLPTSALPTTPVDTYMAADPHPGLVVDLPIGLYPQFMYEQSVHHRPLVQGYAPRLSTRMLSSVTNLPYVVALDALMPLSQRNAEAQAGDIFPLPGGLAGALQRAGIRYVVLHQVPGLPAASHVWMARFLRQRLGPPFSVSSRVIAWQVPATAGQPATIWLSPGSGWLAGVGVLAGGALRYTSQDATLLIHSPRPQPARVTFDVLAFDRPYTLQVYWNRILVKTIPLAATQQQTVDLGTLPLGHGATVLRLHGMQPCTNPRPNGDCLYFGVQHVSVTPGP